MIIKQGIPLLIAVVVGIVTVAGLLLGLPEIADVPRPAILEQFSTATTLLLNWAGFLAAFALLLGVLNLFFVHLGRVANQRSGYSLVLILSMITVFILGFSNLGNNVVTLTDVFVWIQTPLEAALASLLAFFLLLAGFRLFRRRRTLWTFLFLLTVILVMLTGALVSMQLLPDNITLVLEQVYTTITDIFVTAGMRGILIGVALGTITLSLRLLAGVERPYNK